MVLMRLVECQKLIKNYRLFGKLLQPVDGFGYLHAEAIVARLRGK
jgi:hypothetical protein